MCGARAVVVNDAVDWLRATARDEVGWHQHPGFVDAVEKGGESPIALAHLPELAKETLALTLSESPSFGTRPGTREAEARAFACPPIDPHQLHAA